jgi:dissimilatory sulfite reductase (desulfoviridin) alpha/beta subunit
VIHKGKLIKIGRLEELLTVKDELSVVIRSMGDKEKKRLKDFIRQSGLEVLNISERKNSLKDLFIKVINKEKKN